MKIDSGWPRRVWPLLIMIAVSFFWWLALHYAEACEQTPEILKGSTGCLDFWLNRYQTLISGFFTLAAAIATVVYLHQQISVASRQIEFAEKEAKDQKTRLEQASRAILPHALSDISSYADECVAIAIQCVKNEDAIINGDGLRTVLKCPALPSAAFAVIHDAIKWADPEIQIRLAKTSTMAQIQNSRLIGLCDSIEKAGDCTVLLRINLHDAVADALDVSGAVSSIFEYARGERSDEGLFTRPSLYAYDIDDARYPELFDYLQHRPVLYSQPKETN